MKISVKSIPDEGLNIEECEAASALGFTDLDAVVVGTVRSAVRITKMRNSFYVKGSCEAVVQRECGRCLEEYRERLSSDFELIFQEAGSMRPHRERVLEQRDVGVSFYHDDNIDLGPEIRQSIILAIPMKPLCSDDCKGLCPTCGENLNRDACTCGKPAPQSEPETGPALGQQEKKGRLGELLASALGERPDSNKAGGGEA